MDPVLMGQAHLEFSILASAARTVTPLTTGPHVNPAAKGVKLMLDITVVSGTSPTLDVAIQVRDPVTGTFRDLPGASFAQATAASNVQLTVYPGIAETANESVSDVLPKRWRVNITIGGSSTPTFTYSLGAAYLP